MNIFRKKLKHYYAWWVLACCLAWSPMTYAQTRQLPKVNAAKQQAQRALEARKKAVHDKSKAFLQEKLDPRAPYRQLKAKGKDDLQKRFAILKNIYGESKQEVTGFRLPPLLKFNGLQANLEQHTAQRQGNYPLGIPGDFTRFQVNGGVSVLGIPLKVQGLFTTEQSELRQPMNQFSVGLDIATLQRQLQQRIDARLRKLQQVYNVQEYQQLDKLYKFEQIKEIENFTQNEVRQHLGELQQLEDLKELKNLKDWEKNWQQKLTTKGTAWATKEKTRYYQQLGQKLKSNPTLAKAYTTLGVRPEDLSNPKALEKKLKNKSAALKQQTKQLYEQKKAGLKQKYQGSKGKALKKLNKRLGKFLGRQNLSVSDLKNLYENRDSLAKQAPERLLGYENARILKSFKAGKNKEGLQQLQQAGIISLPTFLAASLQTLTVGTSYPEFTDFTLSGARIDGVGIELQPGQLHLAYYGAKNRVATAANNDYARKLKAYRAGWGKKEGTHLFINHVQGQDDLTTFRGDSVITGIGDTSFFDKPRHNTVWGADAKWRWKQWELEVEFAQSMTTLDLSRENLPATTTHIAEFLQQPLTDQGNLQVGQAYGLRLHYQLGERTTLHGKLERITPGFFSLGVPYFRNDIEGGEVSIEQKFWKNQLTVTPLYGYWHDNLTGRKEMTSLMQEYGLNVSLTPQKWPFMALDYRKHLIENNELNNVEILNVHTGYNYTQGSTQMQTTLTALLQETRTQSEEFNLKNISIRNYTLQQVASFSFPLQASAQLNFLDQKGGREEGKWLTVGGSLTYTFWGVWQNSIKGNYGKNQKEGIKYDWGLESSLTFLNYYTLTIGVEQNKLDTLLPLNNYEELRGKIVLSARF
ncbi:AAA family ATPase [Microscilla marina]|uniref:Uncharacterized protein n=1 Tax=Microscilla marina ATCC 23134 TaxID=313606 RepID=A1ZUY4_MICM2|nr:hypothetical protein [Microscilla marina]EAY25762.1 hypothetical protein M23134_03336 [Microscilla marina ATCC 23134]